MTKFELLKAKLAQRPDTFAPGGLADFIGRKREDAQEHRAEDEPSVEVRADIE